MHFPCLCLFVDCEFLWFLFPSKVQGSVCQVRVSSLRPLPHHQIHQIHQAFQDLSAFPPLHLPLSLSHSRLEIHSPLTLPYLQPSPSTKHRTDHRTVLVLVSPIPLLHQLRDSRLNIHYTPWTESKPLQEPLRLSTPKHRSGHTLSFLLAS